MIDTPDIEGMKERTKFVWGLGDYSGTAERFVGAADHLARNAGVAEGQRVLDVAAGNGNLAAAAARRGADVVACDLSPVMVENGRARTSSEGLEVEWAEGDAEDLPFGGGAFDAALSVFGAFIAPRPEVASRELFRVVRPGGTVGMVTWRPAGFMGAFFEVTDRYAPRAPGVPAQAEWGREEVVRERFAPHSNEIEFDDGDVLWEFASAGEWQAFMERHSPPFVAAKAVLPAEGFEQLMADVREVAEEHNSATDGTVRIPAPYLVIVARKAA